MQYYSVIIVRMGTHNSMQYYRFYLPGIFFGQPIILPKGKVKRTSFYLCEIEQIFDSMVGGVKIPGNNFSFQSALEFKSYLRPCELVFSYFQFGSSLNTGQMTLKGIFSPRENTFFKMITIRAAVRE